MAEDPKKTQRIDEVQGLLEDFARNHLTPELAAHVAKLWEQIGRKRNYVIPGGRPEV